MAFELVEYYDLNCIFPILPRSIYRVCTLAEEEGHGLAKTFRAP